MIIYQAKVNQTYQDIPGMLALNFCSICLKSKFEVSVKEGWKEPLNLYTATIREYTTHPTAFIRDMLRTITEYEREQLAEMLPLIKERNSLEDKIKFYKRKYAKDGNLEHLKKIKKLDEQLGNLSKTHLLTLTVDSLSLKLSFI